MTVLFLYAIEQIFATGSGFCIFLPKNQKFSHISYNAKERRML